MDPKDVPQPAFPHVNPNYDANWDDRSQISGMSLRDWFAGQALAGVVTRGFTVEGAAERAFAIADEMMKLREK